MLPLEITRDDEVALWMGGKPAFATLEELFNLVLADPVVLFVVENRDQDIEVSKEILQANGGAEFERDVG